MKRPLLIGALSLAAAAFLAGNAGAQDTTAKRDTLARPGALARTPSHASLIAALSAVPAATEKIGSRTVTATDIRVVEVSTIMGSESDEPIKAALEQHKDAIAALREAIGKNMAYTVALAGHKEKPEAKDVIAVDILDSGDVLVYFKK
jgi:hypothetical protein